MQKNPPRAGFSLPEIQLTTLSFIAHSFTQTTAKLLNKRINSGSVGMKANYDFSWMNCLVVDDNQSVAEYLASLLKDQLGVKQARIAYSADEALRLLDQHTEIQVVLCDLYMEKVDGLEMMRLLKEKQFRGYFGIISSMAAKVIHSAEQLAKSHDINLLGSIAKPVSEEALIKLLSKVGDKPKAPEKGYNSGQLKIYELIRGIEKSQFEVFYQPQIDIKSRQVVGLEALVRLNHPRAGLLYPGKFIPLMEQTSLISELTHFVIKQSLNNWVQWREQGHELDLSINISSIELNNLDFPDFVLNLLQQHHIPAEKLTLEVTESALEVEGSNSLEMLNRLSMQGIRLSIDDFGTGHSSIERLRKYPFDELKIDKDFMANAQKSQSDRSLVESAVVLSKRLGLKVVFEGVETSELYQMSDHLGGDVIQGFYISKAVQADKVIDWIENWHQSNR